jgi:hypothetical protein
VARSGWRSSQPGYAARLTFPSTRRTASPRSGKPQAPHLSPGPDAGAGAGKDRSRCLRGHGRTTAGGPVSGTKRRDLPGAGTGPRRETPQDGTTGRASRHGQAHGSVSSDSTGHPRGSVGGREKANLSLLNGDRVGVAPIAEAALRDKFDRPSPVVRPCILSAHRQKRREGQARREREYGRGLQHAGPSKDR